MTEMVIQLVKIDNGQVLLSIPLRGLPNAQMRECYESDDEIIVLGDPINDDHNCDQMGCSSICHVIYRFKKDK